MSQSLEPTRAAIIVQQAVEDLQQIKGTKQSGDMVSSDREQAIRQSDWMVHKDNTLDAVILVICITLLSLVIGSIMMLGSFHALFWGMVR